MRRTLSDVIDSMKELVNDSDTGDYALSRWNFSKPKQKPKLKKRSRKNEDEKDYQDGDGQDLQAGG